jgi:hypothetical protein
VVINDEVIINEKDEVSGGVGVNVDDVKILINDDKLVAEVKALVVDDESIELVAEVEVLEVDVEVVELVAESKK